MNILLITSALAVLIVMLPKIYNEWCMLKERLEDDNPDYRDRFIG